MPTIYTNCLKSWYCPVLGTLASWGSWHLKDIAIIHEIKMDLITKIFVSPSAMASVLHHPDKLISSFPAWLVVTLKEALVTLAP